MSHPQRIIACEKDARAVERLLLRSVAYGRIPDATIQLHMDRGHAYVDVLRRLVYRLAWGTAHLSRLEGWTRPAAVQVCRRLLGMDCVVPIEYLERIRVAGIFLRGLPRSPYKYL
jgi:hypothetical protein